MNRPTTPERVRSGIVTVTLAVALTLAGPALARPEWGPAASYPVAQSGGAPWSALSPEERQHLQPHRKRWDQYSAQEQQRLRTGVRRYMELSPEQRRRVEQEQQHFREMSPAERQRLREQYRRDKRGY